jgi:hypothetical protein
MRRRSNRGKERKHLACFVVDSKMIVRVLLLSLKGVCSQWLSSQSKVTFVDVG